MTNKLTRFAALAGLFALATLPVAAHAQATFWYVLPSLPMFLVLPAMLRAGVGFWPSLAAGCVLTIALYFATTWALAKFGISL